MYAFCIKSNENYSKKKWKKNQIETQKGEEVVGKGCLLNMFRCENGPCIDEQFRCNGRNDCPFDTSDELDCQTNRKSEKFVSKTCTSLKSNT